MNMTAESTSVSDCSATSGMNNTSWLK